MLHSSRQPLKILLVTDVFPPGSGGSGWSTYYLGRALADLGHNVQVLRPRYDMSTSEPGVRRTDFGGIPVEELFVPAAPPLLHRAGFARAWQERRAATYMARRIAWNVRRRRLNVVHAQHKVSAMSTAMGVTRARRQGSRVAAVASVRDYWPLCPVSTRLFQSKDGANFECASCDRFVPYMKAVLAEGKKGTMTKPVAAARWLATWQSASTLRKCDAVMAVSNYVRDELVKSGRVAGGKVYTVPNLLDLQAVDRAVRGTWPLDDISPEDEFALFVGKLDTNKGAHLLPDAVERAGLNMPVVLLGDGPLQGKIAAGARERHLDFRFHPWLDNDEVLRVMSSARVLLFPSAWQEPLSRVLLEGCAVGAAIVALDTGGTSDIIQHKESGWLAGDMAGFVEGIKCVATDDLLNTALRSGARTRAELAFAGPKIAAEVTDLYYALLDDQEGQRP